MLLWMVVSLVCGVSAVNANCSKFFYARNAEGKCARAEPGDVCTGAEPTYCQTGRLFLNCREGICACVAGYVSAPSLYGGSYCKKVTEGERCTPGDAGDAFCRSGLNTPTAVCHRETSQCLCPPGHIYELKNTCHPIIPDQDQDACKQCALTGGICVGSADNQDSTAPAKCVCPRRKVAPGSLASGCSIAFASVGEMCTEDSSIVCWDTNSACLPDTSLSGRRVCCCKANFVPVRNAIKETSPVVVVDEVVDLTCWPRLSERDDPACTSCAANGGQCYDVNADGVMDGCVCPLTRTTAPDSDDYCAVEHVKVTCDASSVTVCYNPHDTPRFPKIFQLLTSGTAQLYVRGYYAEPDCHFQQQEDGKWCLTLAMEGGDLKPGKRGTCGLVVMRASTRTVTYATWAILQKDRKCLAKTDLGVYVSCTYDTIVHTYTGLVEVASKKEIATEGEHTRPDVVMRVENQFQRDVAKWGATVGELIRLIIEITDDKGVYVTLKPETCIVSNQPSLEIPGVKTMLLLQKGCPQSVEYKDAMFKTDPLDLKLTKSGYFPLCKFADSDFIFFHCAVRVCRHADNCKPSVCTPLSRRRRSIGGPTGLPSSLLDLGPDYQVMRWKRQARIGGQADLDSPDLLHQTATVKVSDSTNSQLNDQHTLGRQADLAEGRVLHRDEVYIRPSGHFLHDQERYEPDMYREDLAMPPYLAMPPPRSPPVTAAQPGISGAVMLVIVLITALITLAVAAATYLLVNLIKRHTSAGIAASKVEEAAKS